MFTRQHRTKRIHATHRTPKERREVAISDRLAGAATTRLQTEYMVIYEKLCANSKLRRGEIERSAYLIQRA